MAVWSCEPEMLSAEIVGGVFVYVPVCIGKRKRETECLKGRECVCVLCEEQRCWATKQEVAAKEGFAVD